MRITRHQLAALMVTLATVVSCQMPSEEDRAAVTTPPTFDIGTAKCKLPGVDLGTDFRKGAGLLACGKEIRFIFSRLSPAPTFTVTEEGEIKRAADQWEEELAAEDLNLPRFGSGTSGTHTVKVVRFPNQGSTTGWCGAVPKVPALPDSIILWRGSCGTSSIYGVALHEMAHILGFTDKWDNSVGSTTTTGHCAGRTYNGQVTGTICQHEIEALYAAYGIRSPRRPNYDTHEVTGLVINAPRTATADGVTRNANVAWLFLQRANGSICPDDVPGDPSRIRCDDARLPTTGWRFTWSSIPSSGLGVTTTGNTTATFRPTAAGTYQVQVRVLAMAHDTSARFGQELNPTTFNVTVSPPPATPTSITLSPTTVRVLNGPLVTVTATVRDAAGNDITTQPGIQVKWQVGDPQMVILYAPTGRTTQLGNGNYSGTTYLKATVWNNGANTGITKQIPVTVDCGACDA